MVTEIFFILGTIDAINTVNRKYKWYHNLEITLRSYKTYFLIIILYWIMLFSVAMLYYLTTILKNKLWQPIKYFGTLNNALGYIFFGYMICIIIYFLLKIFEPNYRIQEIVYNYNTKESQ